jgi:hypothetical protein
MVDHTDTWRHVVDDPTRHGCSDTNRASASDGHTSDHPSVITTLEPATLFPRH